MSSFKKQKAPIAAHLLRNFALKDIQKYLYDSVPQTHLPPAGNNTEAQEFLGRGGQVNQNINIMFELSLCPFLVNINFKQVIIRMRGLPYDCTAKQVVRDSLVLPDNPELMMCLARSTSSTLAATLATF